MIVLGAKAEQIGAMDIDHIFLSRLRLLIIMLKSYIKRYPIGRYRLEGMMHNARIVGDEAVYFWGRSNKRHPNSSLDDRFDSGDAFYEHIKALTLIIEKIEPDTAPDKHMIASVNPHLDYLTRHLISDRNLSDMPFLKVA